MSKNDEMNLDWESIEMDRLLKEKGAVLQRFCVNISSSKSLLRLFLIYK
ncbi:hypothetical protein LEP1GSC058_0154 [Leptospira fainei serovar Hurstbridge str. BUT 6]|uniref:Uncharacterized protein n=1 Tax=Leptospira fainei serovar Hurstbridge str. BUT 6 TaxID=1193011 RepID=S3UXN1_9LEPT|nr:hypothetical protein LEP1GSC058_0154 [Leptospira fainei serovar Hurstbridge str. BUT 6]